MLLWHFTSEHRLSQSVEHILLCVLAYRGVQKSGCEAALRLLLLDQLGKASHSVLFKLGLSFFERQGHRLRRHNRLVRELRFELGHQVLLLLDRLLSELLLAGEELRWGGRLLLALGGLGRRD